MAIEKVKRSQLACKIINIRKIRASTRRMGRLEQPASADDVNDRSQLRNLKSWGTRQAKVHALEERLKDIRREADILERLSHVRHLIFRLTRCNSNHSVSPTS